MVAVTGSGALAFAFLGKNFMPLTDFMIDYFPLYSKFRAVSSIQVILELCIPILAILGLYELIKGKESAENKLKALKLASATTLGIIIVLFLFKGSFDFQGIRDASYRQQFGQIGLPELMDFIVIDRKSMYNQDLLRSFLLVAISIGALWLSLKGKLKETLLIVVFAGLIVFDLGSVDKRYVNKEDFVQARVMEKPFQQSPIDTEILKNKEYYRVFDPAVGLNGARTSYFHKSIGGYHAAKPRRMEELFYHQIAKNNVGVLNMLNVKYIIQRNEQGQAYPATNPFANGNAWFVDSLEVVSSADEEIKALTDLDGKTKAVINRNDAPEAVWSKSFEKDSTAVINLTSYQPNQLKYKSSSEKDQFAVFSDMHYPHGWNAYIDGNKVPHYRVDYVLRAMEIPAGKHEIEFKFEPTVVKKGSLITLGSSLIFLILLAGGLYLEWKKKGKLPAADE